MTSEGGGGACLTIEKPRALLPITEEQLALATRGISVSPCMPLQLRSSRAQHDDTRLGRGLPVAETHQAQAPLQRLVPHHGGIHVPMRLIGSWAESLETAPGLEAVV